MEFRCLVCDFLFFDAASARLHLDGAHVDLIDADVAVTKTYFDRCLECMRSVRRTLEDLQFHLGKVCPGRIKTVEEYEKKYYVKHEVNR
jgi:hypothetical protein